MTIEVIEGDCREVLTGMAEGSGHCCVTSPPYWGLRDYGLEPDVWPAPGTAEDAEAAENCEHEWGDELPGDPRGGSGPNAKEAYTDGGSSDTYGRNSRRGQFCRRCGAWRGCLGLEPTPELYVEHMVEVFRAVRRVLRPDGTLWLNLGDSYAGSPRSAPAAPRPSFRRDRIAREDELPARQHSLKAKDLLGMPWRVAFALQADGWYLRSAIVWTKGLSFCESYSGSVMPESCRDRPTSAYEMMFLLTPSGRYFYDWFAAREQGTYPAGTRAAKGSGERRGVAGVNARPPEYAEYSGTRNWRNVWVLNPVPYDCEYCRACKELDTGAAFGRLPRVCSECHAPARREVYIADDGKRHKRWVQTCQCEDGAITRLCRCGAADWLSHFATYPEKLAAKCITAGTSPKVCGQCGAPWQRVVDMEPVPDEIKAQFEAARRRAAQTTGRSDRFTDGKPSYQRRMETTGFEPTCECCTPEDTAGRSLVLDPFGGSGTTGLAAKRLGRDAVLIELNREYAEMARKRCGEIVHAPLFS